MKLERPAPRRALEIGLALGLVLILAVWVYGEHLSESTLIAFAFIWAGLVVYSLDAWFSLRQRS